MSTTQVQVAGTRRRPCSTHPTPGGPAFGGPAATPRRQAVDGRRPGRVTACSAVPVAAAPASSLTWITRLKVGAVAGLAVLGLGVSVAEFASWDAPGPETPSAADPGWSHVNGR